MVELIIGAILGGIVSWVITHMYYRRQQADAARSEQILFNRFDDVAHRLKASGIDIRALLEAVKAKDGQALDKATKDLVDLQQKVHNLEVMQWINL